MKIHIRETTGFFLGPHVATHARMEEPTPKDQIISESCALMAGKGHEVAVVGGWTGDTRAGSAVFTDLESSCVGLNISEVVTRLQEAGATHAISLHNHPSDDIGLPSSADVDCSRRLREALALAGINLEDSLVISASGDVVSLGHLEEDAGYRNRLCASFRAAMDVRLARLEERSAKRLEEARRRGRIEASLRRLEAVAARSRRDRGHGR
jgi:hypothetical protein